MPIVLSPRALNAAPALCNSAGALLHRTVSTAWRLLESIGRRRAIRELRTMERSGAAWRPELGDQLREARLWLARF